MIRIYLGLEQQVLNLAELRSAAEDGRFLDPFRVEIRTLPGDRLPSVILHSQDLNNLMQVTLITDIRFRKTPAGDIIPQYSE